jgi:hypothetical protein
VELHKRENSDQERKLMTQNRFFEKVSRMGKHSQSDQDKKREKAPISEMIERQHHYKAPIA